MLYFTNIQTQFIPWLITSNCTSKTKLVSTFWDKVLSWERTSKSTNPSTGLRVCHVDQQPLFWFINCNFLLDVKLKKIIVLLQCFFHWIVRVESSSKTISSTLSSKLFCWSSLSPWDKEDLHFKSHHPLIGMKLEKKLKKVSPSSQGSQTNQIVIHHSLEE